MSKQNISFVKLVSPPSATAWAQTYHAGNVYAVVSVIQKEDTQEDPEHAIPSVHVLGKDIINNLEAEYFAIAEKNLQTIKEAVTNACKDISETVAASVLFAVITNNVLYLFLYGTGQVYIKRQNKFGVLLQQEDKQDVLASSGLFQPGDTIILASQQIKDIIPQAELVKVINHPIADIEEKFAAKFDNEKYAGAAAILFSLAADPEAKPIAPHLMTTPIKQDEPIKPKEEPIEEKDDKESKPETEEKKETNKTLPEKEEKLDLDEKPHFEIKERQKDPEEKPKRKQKKLSWRQLFFLLLTLILIGVLAGSIFITKNKQQNNQAQLLFSSEFPSAKQHFDEGNSLLSLNKNLAQDDFAKAKTILEDLQKKLPANSPEAKQVNDLLTQVNQITTPTSGATSSNLTPENTTASKLLAAEIANPNSDYFAQEDSNIYAIDDKAILSIDSPNKTKSIITNNTWNALGGFGVYLGNFYVLDKKANQILKFTNASNEYTKSNYFSSVTPDFSKVTSIAIDGSIWVLSSDGTIKKFTKGQKDSFTLAQPKTPMSHPTRIVTTVNMDNLYILDTGNNQIVVVKKDDGSVLAEYPAKELKNAKDIDVDEKNKKIFVLIDKNIFSIALQ